MSGILLVANTGSCIDIERDLGCTPVNATSISATASQEVAAANTAALQAAFSLADGRVSGGKYYTFVVPNKCYAISTTTLTIPSSVALVGAGGFCNVDAAEAARQGVAVTAGYVNGPTLMRVAPSANPIIKLTGHYNLISNLSLRGALPVLNSPQTFTIPGTGNQTDPYYAGVGIEVQNIADGPISGHHTIACSFYCCTVGIKHTYSGEENQADVCEFPQIEFHQCPTAWQVDNGQSVAHHFNSVYYYAPLMADDSGSPSVLPSGVIFDLKEGGRIAVDQVTVVGPCTVVQTDNVDANTGSVVIQNLHADAGCFNQTRKFRLLSMVAGGNRDFFLRVTGSFSHAGVVSVAHPLGLGEQWYNTDSSNLFVGNLGLADIRADIWGLSTADVTAHGMYR